MKLPRKPPTIQQLLEGITPEQIAKLMSSDAAQYPIGKYEHWEKIRFRKPPDNLTHEQWWLALKFRRMGNNQPLPFLDKQGNPFVYNLPDLLQESLHRIDQDASGRVEVPTEVTNPTTRDRYLVASLFEEAITSSQLEGASTTHKVAKAMLREGRRPRDRSEQMIFNNYRAMEFVRDIVDQDLTSNLLLELHQIVTQGTLDNSSAEGCFRTTNDEIEVIDFRDGTILHVPPSADELPRRIETLCEFANQKTSSARARFVHPVIRSILLHFMIGYDHPFIDGNGRAARALFYWSMAKHRYWMMEFVSISTIIRLAPAQYARAYLYSESDDNDTTYFLDFNLRVIVNAIAKLHHYLARKSEEVRSVDALLGSSDLNHRQIALLSHAIKHPGASYTIESHRKSHGVTYQTARTDLLKLAEQDLLTMNKRGRMYAFRGFADIERRLAHMTRRRSPRRRIASAVE